MTSHILCALDLTHEADVKGLLLEADKYAGFHNAGLSVMTVIPDYGSSWVGSFFKEGSLKEAAEAASDVLKKIVQQTIPDRESVQHIVEIGVAYEKVLEAIETCNADLVVLGAHKPDISDRLLGPNSARIVRSSPVSTLVVRL